MNEYGGIVRAIVKKNIGSARYEEICAQFELESADRVLLDKLLDHWRPDYGIQVLVEIAERYQDYSSVDRV